MKKWLLLVGLVLGVGACSTDAEVLSSDGSKLLKYCHDTSWVECISVACPNGYDIIDISLHVAGGRTSLIKCRHRPADCSSTAPWSAGRNFND